MAKLQYPPQAGERRLCLTLFCTMMLSVVSCVAIIYSIVIIYIPAIDVLEASLEGPKMCTTVSTEGNLTGLEVCDDWSSCYEWCLSSGKTCHHVWATVRELGTQIYWDGCDFPETKETIDERVFIDHTCNILVDIEDINCKLYKYEKDAANKPGRKDDCIKFHNAIISCQAGICKNVSLVYDCTFRSKLQDLIEENNGRGHCHCNECARINGVSASYVNSSSSKVQKYSGECLEDVNICYGGNEAGWNSSMAKTCQSVGCFQCRDICHQRGECFDLKARKDPTKIGVDEFGISFLTYYECRHGYCSEIYDLKCERKCDSKKFQTEGKNSVLFIGERVIMANCAKRNTVNVSSLDEGKTTRSNTLMVACTNVTIDREARTMISEDCVNGTWFEDNFNDGQTNYSHLTTAYFSTRDRDENKVKGIAYEGDLTIYNRTRMLINMQGCVNTLAMECMAFYRNFGGDGRNYTSRAVYQCYYDPLNPKFAVINFDPDQTLILLIFFIAVPFGVMILSCGYMCICSRFVHVADDGHMRMRCCGKYVTGIGNVPRWDPPQRKGLLHRDDVDT